MRITVQLQPTAVRALRKSPAHSQLSQLAAELGITFEPLHPGATDPQLQTFFSVEVDDDEKAQQVIERLLANPAVAAAYTKPLDAAP